MTAGEKTRALKEWALFTSLAVIFGLAGIFLPWLYFLATLCFPIPVILLVVRLDSRYGLLGLAAAGLIIITAIPFQAAALVLIVQYGLLGILYGLLFKNGVSSGKSVFIGIAVSVVLAFLSIWLVYAATGQNPFILDQEGRQAAEQWLAANRNSGGLPTEWQGFFMENIISLFELLLPGQFAVTAAAASALTYLLARVVLRRLNFSLPPAIVFTGIYLPWYSIWGLIAGLGLVLAGDFFSWALAAKAGKNILFIFFYAYLILGLSVAAHFFLRVRLARPVKILFLFLAFAYIPFSMMLVLLLGVTDPLVNFRRFPSAKD